MDTLYLRVVQMPRFPDLVIFVLMTDRRQTKPITLPLAHACGVIKLYIESCIYYIVPGKHPWVLKHNSQFWPAWALTRDQNPICLYKSCYSGPMKCGTWVLLTWEWALARDITMYTDSMIILYFVHHYFVCYSAPPVLSETVRKCPLCQRCNLVIKRKRDGGYVSVHT